MTLRRIVVGAAFLFVVNVVTVTAQQPAFDAASIVPSVHGEPTSFRGP